MKKLISVILCILMIVCSVPACFADNYQFRDGITWGMTPDEVLLIENNPGAQRVGTVGSNYEFISCPGVSVSAYSNALLIYAFCNNRLFGAMYVLDAKDNPSYIVDALTFKYGQGEKKDDLGLADPAKMMISFIKTAEGSAQNELADSEIALLIPAFKFTNGILWALPDGTKVTSCTFSDDASTLISYICPMGIPSFNTNGL